MLGYLPLDTVILSEITSPYNKSKPVIINITNATTAESLSRTLPEPPPWSKGGCKMGKRSCPREKHIR